MYDDFSRVGIRVAMPRSDGTIACLVRVPCYVAAREDPSNPHVLQAALRDKVTNRFLVTSCPPYQIPEHAIFLQQVLQATSHDPSIWDPSGKSYIVACGWLVDEDSRHIVIAMESPRTGYKLELQQ